MPDNKPPWALMAGTPVFGTAPDNKTSLDELQQMLPGTPAPTMGGRLRQLGQGLLPDPGKMLRGFTAVPQGTKINTGLWDNLKRLGNAEEWNQVLDDVEDFITNPFRGTEEAIPRAKEDIAEAGGSVSPMGMVKLPPGLTTDQKFGLLMQYYSNAIPYAGGALSTTARQTNKGDVSSSIGSVTRAMLQSEAMPEELNQPIRVKLPERLIGRTLRAVTPGPVDVAENISDLGEYVTNKKEAETPQESPVASAPLRLPPGLLRLMRQPVADPNAPIPDLPDLLKALQSYQGSQ